MYLKLHVRHFGVIAGCGRGGGIKVQKLKSLEGFRFTCTGWTTRVHGVMASMAGLYSSWFSIVSCRTFLAPTTLTFDAAAGPHTAES